MNCNELNEQLIQLHEEGLEAEKTAHDALAVERYRQSTELAESSGNLLVGHHLRWHWGFSLVKLRKYRQATAVLTPLLWQTPPYRPDEVDFICPELT